MDSAESIGYRIGHGIGLVIGSVCFWPFVLLSISALVFVLIQARRQSSR